LAKRLPKIRGEFLQAIDRLDDVLFRRARVDRAEAKRGPAFERGRGKEGEAIPEHQINELRLERIVLAETESNDRHLRWRKNFAAGPLAQFAFGELGQLKATRNCGAKRGQTESVHRQPDLQGTESAGELDAVIGGIDLGGVAMYVAHVLRH